MTEAAQKSELAILGGSKAVTTEAPELFRWPVITTEAEEAALAVLRAGTMSGTDITEKFEQEFAAWQGTKHALGCNNGTAALHSAMWACGVGSGTEIIAPSVTYWATALPALNLGAAINFADIEPDTFNLNPDDIEHRINTNTRAIVVVHLYGYPADMDRIMAIARKHKLKVIEDVSHAQGGLYKGRKLGSIGDVGAMSLMAGKSFAIGEGGMLVTNDRLIFERAAAFGHYERTGFSKFSKADRVITDPWLSQFAGLPLGGFKYRMHQLSSAVGRVQLKLYDGQIAEISRAMNYFLDKIKDLPGIVDHRPKYERSTMGGWYAAAAGYRPEALGGLSVAKFCEAVQAEGGFAGGPINLPLHLHEMLHSADIYGDGKPTALANSSRDTRQGKGSLPVAEGVSERAFFIPWFKKFNTKLIDEHVAAYRKVTTHHKELL